MTNRAARQSPFANRQWQASGRLLYPPPRRGDAAIGTRLIDHAVARQDLGEDPRIGGLLHVEGIEAGAHQKVELVAQNIAGGAQRAAKAVLLAQKPRLAIGAAVAEFREFERKERDVAEPRRKLGDAAVVRP